MRLFARLIVALIVVSGVLVTAQPASALQRVCKIVTYRIDASAQSDYGRTIPRAQRMISELTGIAFVPAAPGQPADATYVQHPESVISPVDEVLGVVGMWDKPIVRLTTQPKYVRLSLVLHETLHVVGVHHVDDPMSVMSPIFTWSHILTEVDLQAISAVSCLEDIERMSDSA